MAGHFRRHGKVAEVYCGEGIWVLNKPAGVLSHPNPPARLARNAILQEAYDNRLEAYGVTDRSGRQWRVELIHRLDQDTSGLILLAFDPDVAARLKEMFFHREVEKEYRALVRGTPEPGEGVWRDELRKTRGRGHLTVERVRGGRPNAETRYRLVKAFPRQGLSLLAFRPATGRTHQLRVQAAARGHPIAGDGRYGDFTWNRRLRTELGLRRMFLHAHRLAFRHPTLGRRLRFLADPGRPLEAPLEHLEEMERSR